MKRRTGIVIAAAAGAVLLAGAAAAWWLTRPPNIEDAAQSYLDALAAGDLSAIDDMRQATLDDPAEQTLRDAFAGAEEYITDGHVVEIGEGGAVRAGALLGGSEVDVLFTLAWEDDLWLLTDGYLAELTVASDLGDSAWVGDVLVPLATGIRLLPARYSVEPAPRAVLDGAASADVAGDIAATVSLEATLSADAAVAAQSALDAYADGCAAPAETVPDACGLRVPWAADLAALDGVAYRIDAYPQAALDPASGSFAATGGVVVATATGTAHGGGTAEFTYRAEDWALYGDVSFAGDEMVLRVR